MVSGDSYNDKKFEQFHGSLYRTVFKSDNVWVQIVFDKSNNELLFMTSRTEDITSFDSNKTDVTGDFVKILRHVLYITPFMMTQLKLSTIMIKSRPHTKKTYDVLFGKKISEKFGLELVAKSEDSQGNSVYTFKKK